MGSPKPALGYASRTEAVLALRTQGLSTEEIARRLDIEPKTVSALELSAARRRQVTAADMLDARGIREGVNRLRQQVEARSLPASELSGYTISLSNFGMFAGRYATPVVVPPCVAIVAAGRARHQVVPVMGGIETHKIIPLSVTFDHRAATGGEAARFLRALIDDLALPQ